LYCGWLGYRWVDLKNSVASTQRTLEALENAGETREEALQAARNLAMVQGLYRLASERELFAPILSAAQLVIVPGIQVEEISLNRGLKTTEVPPPPGSMEPPGVEVTEYLTLMLKVRNYGDLDNLTAFKEKIKSTPFFEERLRKGMEAVFADPGAGRLVDIFDDELPPYQMCNVTCHFEPRKLN